MILFCMPVQCHPFDLIGILLSVYMTDFLPLWVFLTYLQLHSSVLTEKSKNLKIQLVTSNIVCYLWGAVMMLLSRIKSRTLIAPLLLICSNVFAMLANLAHCHSKTTQVLCCRIFDQFQIDVNDHQKAIHVHFSKCCFVFLMSNFKKRNIFNKIFTSLWFCYLYRLLISTICSQKPLLLNFS